MHVVAVNDGGRSGRRVAFAPIGEQSPASPNDPHAVEFASFDEDLRPYSGVVQLKGSERTSLTPW